MSDTGPSRGHYRPAPKLVKWVTGLFVVNAAIGLLAAGFGGAELGAIERAETVDGLYTEAESFYLWQAFLGLVQLGVTIALIVVFLVWVHRANSNARALGATHMQFTPGWCVGWFFIPIANLFKPYQAVKEIWMASSPVAWQQREVPGLLPAWWALWITMSILGNISARLTMGAETLDELTRAVTATLASDLLEVPASIAALLVVRGIHRQQESSYVEGTFD